MFQEVEKREAQDWFSQYHYTGSAAGHRFFLVDGPCMVAIGRGGNRFGVVEKFGLEKWKGNLEITRVACHPHAPRNTASKSVAAVCRHLADEGWEWLFSYSDTAQGHHGGIYQAVGAIYVGTDAKQWVNFELNGRRVSKRMISGKFGHTRWPEVKTLAEAEGHKLCRVPWMPKLTYILPIASSKTIRLAIKAALEPLALPYPKRTDELHKLSTKYRNHRPK